LEDTDEVGGGVCVGVCEFSTINDMCFKRFDSRFICKISLEKNLIL